VAVDASGAERLLATCEQPCIAIFGWDLSPDGRWLAYDVSTCVGALPCEGQAGLWVVDARGDRIQLTHPCDPDGCPRPDSWAWLPTGASMVAATGDGLDVLDLIAGERRSLVSSPGQSWVNAIAPAPDGSRVAYADRAGTWTVEVAGGEPVLVTDLSTFDSIAWSPDGERLVIAATTDDRNRLYVLAADGSTPGADPIVEQAAPEGPAAPTWSPDGLLIAYVTTPREGNGHALDVWTIRPDGSEPVRIAALPCCRRDWEGPVWSRDGSRVAIGHGSMWYAVPADGTGEPREIDVDTVEIWRSA
jgi:Tol biopolymer transport system component